MPLSHSSELDKVIQRVFDEAKRDVVNRLEKELGDAAHGQLDLVLNTAELLLRQLNAAPGAVTPIMGGEGSGLMRLANLAARCNYCVIRTKNNR